MGNPQIRLTKHQYGKLKKKYNNAKDNGWKTFHFQGKEVLVGYAKALIEYAETANPDWAE